MTRPEDAVQVTPTVVIDGVSYPQGTGGLPLDGQVLLDDVEVTWGRRDTLDQPEPSTGRLVMFDATNRWAFSRQMIGVQVDLGWVAKLPKTPFTELSRVYFRGRVNGVTVARHVVQLADGSQLVGSLVTMELSDKLNSVANVFLNEAWPSENLSARRARLAAAIPNSVPGGVATRPEYDAYGVVNMPANRQVSVWDHLLTLYDSCGADRMTVDPDAGSLSYVRVRDFRSRQSVGLLTRNSGDGTALDGQGVYIRARNMRTPGGAGVPQVHLDAQGLEYDPADGVTKAASAGMTRVELDYPNDLANITSRGYYVQNVQGITGAGVRTLRVTSVVGTAASVANMWAQLCEVDATAWGLEPLVMRTARAGFDTLDQVAFLMRGGEVDGYVFLQRSYLPQFQVSPVYGVMGGTIAHRNGGWELEWVLSPVRVTANQVSVTWENVDDGTVANTLEWQDVPHPKTFHETVTYEDIAHVAAGFGIADPPTAGPDSEWTFTLS